MIHDSAILSLRASDDADEVVRAVCDLALTGEPIYLPDADPDLRDMGRASARRWCAEAIRYRDDERPVGIPGALVGRP